MLYRAVHSMLPFDVASKRRGYGSLRAQDDACRAEASTITSATRTRSERVRREEDHLRSQRPEDPFADRLARQIITLKQGQVATIERKYDKDVKAKQFKRRMKYSLFGNLILSPKAQGKKREILILKTEKKSCCLPYNNTQKLQRKTALENHKIAYSSSKCQSLHNGQNRIIRDFIEVAVPIGLLLWNVSQTISTTSGKRVSQLRFI